MLTESLKNKDIFLNIFNIASRIIIFKYLNDKGFPGDF